MLTRHLYRIDEVKASCRYALLKKNYREALFWSMELIDTMMSEDLKNIMISVWFLAVGRSSYPLLLELLRADNESLLEFVGAFCSVERDASIYTILTLGSLDWEKQPDRVVPMNLEGIEDKEVRCIMRAIKQGKSLFAWTLLRCRWSVDAWELLLGSAQSRERSVLEVLREIKTHIWEARAAAVMLISDKGGGGWKAIKRFIDEKVFDEFLELEGKRARRIYKIRPEAILYETERGEMARSVTNIQEIREPLTALYGSPYWDVVAEDFGGWKPIYKSDTGKETFYELYFPDDIPDEWSRDDQEKSHGLGLAFADQTTVERKEKQYRNMLGSLPSMGLVSRTCDAIKVGLDLSLYETKQTVWAELQKAWKLEPAIKKIVVLE
jgi:hypothetical protein